MPAPKQLMHTRSNTQALVISGAEVLFNKHHLELGRNPNRMSTEITVRKRR
jgi:hypothetical protein